MEKLFIAKHTLRNHITHVRKKLGAHSIRDIVRLNQTMQEKIVSTLRFSPRGKEVFLLLKEGVPHKRIAEHLGMSVNGVKRHRDNMLLQNSCKSILELIAKYNGTGGGSPDGNNT
jgi:DNA-binding CsgD family transcriptional regulator